MKQGVNIWSKAASYLNRGAHHQEKEQLLPGASDGHNSLSDIRGQIERLAARKKLLENSVAMSQINLSLLPVEIASVEGFQPQQIFGEALTRFGQALQQIGTALIWAVVFSPLGLVLVGLGFVARQMGHKWFRRNNAPDEEIEFDDE